MSSGLCAFALQKRGSGLGGYETMYGLLFDLQFQQLFLTRGEGAGGPGSGKIPLYQPPKP